jgi:glycosyltransferase involved in cell wall biosynthesis
LVGYQLKIDPLATKTNQKILYYSNSCGLHDLKFIRVLSKLSRNVLVVSRSGNSIPEELAGKVHFHSLSTPDSKVLSTREAIRKLKEIFEDHQPKVSIAGPLWPCAYEAAMANAPKLIATSWAYDVLIDARRSPKIRQAIARALSAAQMALFDSPWVCEEARKVHSFPKSKAKIFPWGVDTKRFRPKPGDRINASQTFEILHTRTLDKIYRPEVLLRAFHLAVQKKPHFRLKIIGVGPLLPKMKKLSKNLSLEKNVDWIPPVPNHQLPAVFKKASLYTTAACSDGVSISLLEAMATGLPVVVPNLPSNLHLLSPRHRGQTFCLDDPRSMAEKWIAISDWPRKARAEIGAANRAKVEKSASLQNFQENYSQAVSQFLYD